VGPSPFLRRTRCPLLTSLLAILLLFIFFVGRGGRGTTIVLGRNNRGGVLNPVAVQLNLGGGVATHRGRSLLY